MADLISRAAAKEAIEEGKAEWEMALQHAIERWNKEVASWVG